MCLSHLCRDAPPQPPSQRIFYPAPLSDEHQKILDCIKRTCRNSLSKNKELTGSSNVSEPVVKDSVNDNKISSEQELSPKQLTESTTRSPDHTTRSPDCTVRLPDGTVRSSDYTMRLPDGTARSPDHTTRSPDHTTRSLDRTTRSPDHTMGLPDHTTESPDRTTRSPELATRPAVKSPKQVIKSPDRGITKFPKLLKLPLRSPERTTELPELSNQVIKSPNQALTSRHKIKSLGRPLSAEISSPVLLRSPKQVVRIPEQQRSPELSKQGIASSEVTKWIQLPELSKQELKSPDTVMTLPSVSSTDPSPSRKQGVRSPVGKSHEQIGRSHEQVKRKQEFVTGSGETSHREIRRSCEQVKKVHVRRRSHDPKTSGKLADKLVDELAKDQASNSSPGKLSEEKTTSNESPTDRLLGDNRVCRLTVTPLKTSPVQQQSNSSSDQQQTNKSTRQKKRQPVIIPERRILKLPKKHFPSWRGQNVVNCEVSQSIDLTNKNSISKSNDDKQDSKCVNSSKHDGECASSTEHCDSQCSSSKHFDNKCTSSTEHCGSESISDSQYSSSKHYSKCTGPSKNHKNKCDSDNSSSTTGLCNNDAIKRTVQNTIFGDSAGYPSNCGSDVGCDHLFKDKLLPPNIPALTCSNTECTLPMNISSSDKDPRQQNKVLGVKRPSLSEDDSSTKKCCCDRECESRPDLLSDLPQHFSYVTLYQGLIKCSKDISDGKKPALSNPGAKEAIKPAHPVLQEHSYPVYHDIEMPLLLEQPREAPSCLVCLDEKMWVCMLCEKVTHSWCLSRPHTYCWDCLSRVGNIFSDIK